MQNFHLRSDNHHVPPLDQEVDQEATAKKGNPYHRNEWELGTCQINYGTVQRDSRSQNRTTFPLLEKVFIRSTNTNDSHSIIHYFQKKGCH